MMKNLIFCLLTGIVTTISLVAAPLAGDRPNIILVMTDDQGFGHFLTRL